ncbi:MAG: DUF1080 domain-containing protein [Prolixibacteraceae bacterium]|mgnify:CR=1 FL=1|jgi:hypothetical protein|nr:DUF1080 domain-containing protein [Prolixibacteraceae bacterium]MBT6005456.1 DUF1080 domain-containing protein [Prolixibacteraceae bacterium]MBT6766371.1 DUF1080 domain-containing protein [Prolixibacteraceae bacterium]MBT6999049.1 DUF1080 domain-containing protein [Prolixibacteraceae bacterium]MBT7394452.1 DUF1080 domain-containing protein [Prolixibacteraceae bacterium]
MNKLFTIRNFRFLISFFIILAFTIPLNAQNTLSKKEIKQGWQILFNGSDFDGWRGVNHKTFPEKGWAIKNKTITNTGEKGGSIITTVKFGNFELVWEWRMVTPGANSGLKYFVVEREGDTGGYGYGIEYQMLDDSNHEWMKSGQMKSNDFHTLGSAYELYEASPDKKPKKLGKWNSSKIVCNNGKVEHWLNGKKILEYDRFNEDFKEKVAASKFKNIENYGLHKKGHILLQDHASEVYFKNIKIRKL